ncbi:unnamed protein product [Laminaria digitata]
MSEVYCKLHAEDGVDNFCTKRSPNDSCTVVGASWRAEPDDVPTVCARLKREILDDPVTSVSVEALCEASGCLKRSRWGIHGEQRTHCLDHALLEEGVVARTADVDMACTKEYSCFLSPLGPKIHLDNNGDGGGTATKRTRHRQYRRAAPP